MEQKKIIRFSETYRLHYKERIKPNTYLRRRTLEALILFEENRSSPDLKDHQLTGKQKMYRAFSVANDIRILYRESKEVILLADIGTHKQLYIR